MPNGLITYQEILSQPEAWEAALKILKAERTTGEAIDPARQYEQIMYTGCGSSYYLALAAAALTQTLTGRSCRAFPASELWLYPASAYTASKTLLVAASRSGETTETLRACQAFLSDRRGDLLTLSCYGEMPLAKLGTFNLVFPSGQESSVAQTRALSTLYLATVALACLWSGRLDLFDALARLPEAGRRVLAQALPLAKEIGPDASLERFYWLGSGPRYGLACELSLKMKEMSLSHSEPFHFMEFRHGPKSMVTPASLVIGLRSTANRSSESAVLEEMKGMGGRTLELAEADAPFQFKTGLDEAIQNVLYLPVGQLIAFERARSKGLDPDRPTNLDSVVKLS
ncbi:MAG TPA: SIS domain-containing protein [Anaerolineales bacterium]|nr:SIS domain-containing protein [Anaerolineales bacterium]